MAKLRTATPAQKRRIAQCPYWVALYSSKRRGMETPEKLMHQYRIWNKWALWQYGGVRWDSKRGRSIPQYYVNGSRRAPAYFGNLDRPTERNMFNGSKSQLYSFWNRHAWQL